MAEGNREKYRTFLEVVKNNPPEKYKEPDVWASQVKQEGRDLDQEIKNEERNQEIAWYVEQLSAYLKQIGRTYADPSEAKKESNTRSDLANYLVWLWDEYENGENRERLTNAQAIPKELKKQIDQFTKNMHLFPRSQSEEAEILKLDLINQWRAAFEQVKEYRYSYLPLRKFYFRVEGVISRYTGVRDLPEADRPASYKLLEALLEEMVKWLLMKRVTYQKPGLPTIEDDE